MAGDVGVAQPLRAAQRLDAQQLGLVAHLGLHRVEPDERVELGEQLLERLGGGSASVARLAAALPAAIGAPCAAGAAVGSARPAELRGATDGRVARPRASCALPITVAVAERRDRQLAERRGRHRQLGEAPGVAPGRGRRRSSEPPRAPGVGPRRVRACPVAAAPSNSRRGEPNASAHAPARARRVAARPRPRPRPPRRDVDRGRRCRSSDASSSAASRERRVVVVPRQRLCGSMRERAGRELLGEEPAVGDQRVGVGPARGVEHVVHLRTEQVELVAQHRERGLAARDRRAGRRSREAGAGTRRPPRAGSWSRCARPRGPAPSSCRADRAAGWSGGRCPATRSTRACTASGTRPRICVTSSSSDGQRRRVLVDRRAPRSRSGGGDGAPRR